VQRKKEKGKEVFICRRCFFLAGERSNNRTGKGARVKARAVRLQFVLMELLGQLSRQALIGTFAGEHPQRFQSSLERFVTQEHFDVGGRTVPAAGGIERLQSRRHVKGGAVGQIDSLKVLAQLLGRGQAPRNRGSQSLF